MYVLVLQLIRWPITPTLATHIIKKHQYHEILDQKQCSFEAVDFQTWVQQRSTSGRANIITFAHFSSILKLDLHLRLRVLVIPSE